MGRVVKFNFGTNCLESEIVKVDRTKLYGSSKKIVKDNNGDECMTSDLYEGSRILPKGSISQVLVDHEGKFIARSELIGFDQNNKKVNKVSSIFSITNECSKVDLNEFLSVNVKSIYQLKILDDNIDEWKKGFKDDNIYHFTFNYREDFEGDDAYIISNDNNFFIVVGKKNSFEFLEQDNISVDDEEEIIDDELDFSMF